jgi:hypothetical protein
MQTQNVRPIGQEEKIPAADSFVSFTPTFQYLGLLISYHLCDDDDITSKSLMGALKKLWGNPHLEVYNKYLLFRAIPMNLLLWDTET